MTELSDVPVELRDLSATALVELEDEVLELLALAPEGSEAHRALRSQLDKLRLLTP
jgi:hypothetical protein